jgi:hypothetical protein
MQISFEVLQKSRIQELFAVVFEYFLVLVNILAVLALVDVHLVLPDGSFAEN